MVPRETLAQQFTRHIVTVRSTSCYKMSIVLPKASFLTSSQKLKFLLLNKYKIYVSQLSNRL